MQKGNYYARHSFPVFRVFHLAALLKMHTYALTKEIKKHRRFGEKENKTTNSKKMKCQLNVVCKKEIRNSFTCFGKLCVTFYAAPPHLPLSSNMYLPDQVYLSHVAYFTFAKKKQLFSLAKVVLRTVPWITMVFLFICVCLFVCSHSFLVLRQMNGKISDTFVFVLILIIIRLIPFKMTTL